MGGGGNMPFLSSELERQKNGAIVAVVSPGKGRGLRLAFLNSSLDRLKSARVVAVGSDMDAHIFRDLDSRPSDCAD